MRGGIVVLVCALASCANAPNGTYFFVSGGSANITFDEIEFFLGKPADDTPISALPFTPNNPYMAILDDANETGLVEKRLFAPDDLQSNLGATQSATYYLPPDPGNQFPHYLMVVASHDGEPIGIGEVEKFNVGDDAAYRYDIELEPIQPDAFERWGSSPEEAGTACVRWTKPRGGSEQPSTTAVIREFDHDCDGLIDRADCDDLNFCTDDSNNPGCRKRLRSCIASETCDVGICSDATTATAAKTCKSVTCLAESLCRPMDECVEDGDVDAFLTCAVTKISMSHSEVRMPVTPTTGLCVHSFDVLPPMGMRCTTPEIVTPSGGKVGIWRITVATSTTNSEACTFTWSALPMTSAPPADTHVMISLPWSTNPFRRTTFVVGFQPFGVPPGCQSLYTVQPPTSPPPTPMCP